jgi:hypothetical protein
MSRRATVATFVVALAAGACSRPTPPETGCSRDDQCSPGLACASGECVPFAAMPQSWAVEISPLPEAPKAAFTELASTALAGSALDVTTAAKANLVITFTLEAPSAALARAHVVLTVPSAIPGRPDLTFETNLPESAAAGLVPAVTLPIPADIIGRRGTLQILPTAPDNVAHAPARFDVTVATAVTLNLAAKALTIRGRLLSAVGDPRPGYTARAFTDGVLLSNAAVTGADGVFSLMVPADLVKAPAAGPMVSVDITPPPEGAIDPWLSVKPFVLTPSKDLGDLTLPPFSQANVFSFVAHGHTSDGPMVARAVVRAHTVLTPEGTDQASFVTDFQRDGVTNAEGRADLGLLPGSSAALRNYDLAVIPPPGSLYGLRCIAKFPLSAGGTAESPANVAPVVLPARPLLVGTITGSDGAPAPDVVIVATRTAADPAAACPASIQASPATTTTDEHGVYTLPLDPGVYRIDYDPPARAAVPRLTETGVVVAESDPAAAGSQAPHSVRLPAGVLVEGTTRDSTGAVLPLAGVRLYEVTCTSSDTCTGPRRVSPILRAQARSDATGHFRVVVAAP